MHEFNENKIGSQEFKTFIFGLLKNPRGDYNIAN